MTTNNSFGSLLYANPTIYIDTASLMETVDLEQFISNEEELLLKKRRQIIVSQGVYLELVRHLCSNHPDKQEKALCALKLLKEHEAIFEVHDQQFSEDQVYEAFADAEILAELTRNKRNGGQMLITNDRALSTDAYKLNSQDSCHGYRITVCFINHLGELQKRDCVGLTAEEASPSISAKEPDVDDRSEVSKESEQNAKSICSVPDMTTDAEFSIWNIVIPIGTYALGFLSCKYGKTAIQAIKSFV